MKITEDYKELIYEKSQNVIFFYFSLHGPLKTLLFKTVLISAFVSLGIYYQYLKVQKYRSSKIQITDDKWPIN